jgi:glycosyltransferase involved in cell wall biosynthesis
MQHSEFEFINFKKPSGRNMLYHYNEIRYALGIVKQGAYSKADIILLQRNLRHFWPLLFVRLFNINIIVSLHNTLWPFHREQKKFDRIISYLNGYFFRACTKVIAVSNAIKEQVESTTGNNSVSVSVHIPQYNLALKDIWLKRQYDKEKLTLIYVGRIEENKGIFFLLSAFSELAIKYSHLELKIVGDGSHQGILTDMVARSDYEQRIYIKGLVNGDQVFLKYRALTYLFVQPWVVLQKD